MVDKAFSLFVSQWKFFESLSLGMSKNLLENDETSQEKRYWKLLTLVG